MEEDSTPASSNDDGGNDDFDISAEDHSQDTFDENAADSGDDSQDDDSQAGDSGDDNAPSDSEDEDSGDDDKSTTEDKDSGDKAPTFDKDLEDWAVKHGHDKPENDKERKLLQTIRNGQRDFSKSREADKKVGKAVDDATKPDDASGDDSSGEEALKQRIDAMEANQVSESYRRQTSEYFLTQAQAGTPIPDAEGEAMAELLTQYKEKDGTFGVKFLLGDIPRWHRLARLELSGESDNSEELDEAGKKAARIERERIAKESKASGPTKSAKQTTTAQQKSELDKIWEDDSI